MVTDAELARGIPEDLKPTELGPLPNDWLVLPLGELYDMQQGKALSPAARLGKSPKPFLRTANVLWGRLDLSVLDQMDFSEAECERLALHPGDLLICEGGDIGRTAIWSGEVSPCFHQNHIHRLRRVASNIEPKFHMYWMQEALLHLRLYGGAGNKTTIPNLSKARLGAFLVPVPPLKEQRAMAHVLSTIQHTIEATERVIAAAREFKRSLMRYLFTYGPVPLAEAERVTLKETEIDPMPEHWGVVSLGKVTTASQYGLSLRGSADGAFPILRMNNLANGHVDSSRLQYVNLDGNSFRKFKVHKGDILFNRTNSHDLVGKTALFDSERDFVFASYLIRVVTDGERLCPQYLNDLLNWDPSQVRLKALASRGVSQSNISASKLRNLEVPLPPTSEQRHIADILSAVVHKIETEEKRKTALQELFRTMLHLLMTGQVRVRNFLPKAEKEVS